MRWVSLTPDDGGSQKDDERIDLDGEGTLLFIERKALWAGEGGLLGCTLDIDDNFAIVVTPKEAPVRQSPHTLPSGDPCRSYGRPVAQRHVNVQRG